MAEPVDIPQFGVLQSHSNSVSCDASVVGALENAGLDALGGAFSRALWAALIDRSYIYENQRLLPNMTKWHLEALNRLGAAFLRRVAMIAAYRDPAATNASMSKYVARCADSFVGWAEARTWLAQSATVGRGLAMAATLPRKVVADLGKQLLGLLCVAGQDHVAERLVADLVSEISQPAKLDEPKSVLARELAPDIPSYDFVRDGPDHSLVFHAIVVDPHGRRGEGTGASKKASSNAAAQDFLDRHCHLPAISDGGASALSLRPQAIPRPSSHVRTVGWLRELFALSREDEALLSQALIHSSWMHENKALVAWARQRDNSVLGFVGSEVLEYEHALAVMRELLSMQPTEFMFLSIENEVCEAAFQQMGLASGLLLGKGQAQMGATLEIRANTLQALIGAVAVAKNFPASLEKDWPPQWHSIWADIASNRSREFDPTTQLAMVAAVIPIEVAYEVARSGPDHASTFEASASIHSPALNLRTTVRGGPNFNKAKAKHSASIEVLAALDELSDVSGIRSLRELAGEDIRSLARFLLAAQVAAVPTASNQLKKWASARLCGLHLVDDRRRLAEWACQADSLLGDRLGHRVVAAERLSDAFRATSVFDEFNAIDRELSTVLVMIGKIDNPEELAQEHVDRVVQLCDVYRCLGSKEPDVELSTLAEELRLRYRTKIVIAGDLPSITLSGRERAGLSAAAAAVLRSQSTATVEALPGSGVRLAFRSEGLTDHTRFELVSRLWNVAVQTLEMTGQDEGIDVYIARSEGFPVTGAISRAAHDAMMPKADQYRSSLADLLHDLKNQLVAARVAASAAVTGGTRTAQLRQKLAASTHLDEAQTLALRLQTTTSVFGSAVDGDIDLGAFLRDYSSRVLTWLPHSISLYIPAAERVARVEVGAPVLLAVLDNLIKNSVEAMSDGGTVSIEWTADQYEAVVEIADNGPGLPDDVAAAWAQRRRIHSSKSGGNGLGLWSAQALLSRVGGRLALQPTNRGTTWLLTLPSAPDSGAES